MIDLTPLDVRKKRGDFGKGLRGYDPPEVDGFLELVAERMEELVKENLAFREQVERLGEKVVVQEGREKAVQDALVTAQELRQDVKKQASREAKLLEREARGRVEGMIRESEKLLTDHQTALQELERQRERFLKAFRTFLERELDTVAVEFGRAPLETVTLNFELGKRSWSVEEDEEEEKGAEKSDAGKVEGASAEDSAASPDLAVVPDDPPDAESASPDLAVVPDDPPPAKSSPSGKKDGAKEPGEAQPPEGEEGGDSLWLSSIMTDREEKDAE
jgi:DivIVA domain-containing protein